MQLRLIPDNCMSGDGDHVRKAKYLGENVGKDDGDD